MTRRYGLEDLLGPDVRVERLGGGMTWAEGPLWVPARRAVRCSDIPGDRVMEWRADDGAWGVLAHPVGFTNGRTLGLDGEVVQCSHGNRRVEVERDGVVTPLVTSWRGHRLNSPNDVVVRSDGTVWFTDPAYGIHRPAEGHPGEEEYGGHHVFRLDPATGELDAVVTDVAMPNGLAFSADEARLYVADSSRSPSRPDDPPGDGHAVHVYDVVDGRRCTGGRVLAEVEPGVPDGVRVDELGHVWTTAGSSLVVLRPDGSEVGRVDVGEVVSNLCFGGDGGTDVFATASTSLVRLRARVRDAAHVHSPRG
ncbi:SMP-30/gluconolactonase/LRE family protein [Pseudokineococcus basanitobsidens]|uniref:SMP-30/gluconolactonase/LRE family protein n=1 Tax=Pseudokineococcus basanitobsidens TaxID=1926649 RepID=A0ABU8RMX5_9ACTN